MTPNYQKWRDEGHLLAPPGKVIDYAAVANHVLGVSQVFNPKWIAYDSGKNRDILVRSWTSSGPNSRCIRIDKGFSGQRAIRFGCLDPLKRRKRL